MIAWIVDEDTPLPRPGHGDPELPGLVAAGGSLSTARLEEAYRLGIFPWYGPGQPVLWWSPDPRMVLPVQEFRLARSLRKTLRRFLRTPGCEIRFDNALQLVVQACASRQRKGQDGTWIVPEMAEAYVRWHAGGGVHSAETWVDGELVGGLYFVAIGRMVFGESMFALRNDASKLALTALVAACRARGVAWIDCQQYTHHLAGFGAREVPRPAFERHLALTLGAEPVRDWTYDRSHWACLDPTLTGPQDDPA